MATYKFFVPATREQGTYSGFCKDSFQQTFRQDALHDYNSGRAHDGLPPLKKMPAGTKYILSKDNLVSKYTSAEAIDDGVLMKNPRQNRFPECNIITTNLWGRIEEMANNRNTKRVNAVEPVELLGSLMAYANKIYTTRQFKGDNDKDFFVLPATEEGVVVWFARNEYDKLTAMLPEDY
jgi:hypothetical protein